MSGKNIYQEQLARVIVACRERGYSIKDAIKSSDREIKDYRSYLLPSRKDADIWIVMKDKLWTYDIFFDYPIEIFRETV